MEEIVCNFCRKKKYQVNILISSDDANICNNCIEKANILIQSELKINNKKLKEYQQLNIEKDNNHILNKNPKEIKEFLDNYIIDQDIAKRKIAVAVYNHYKRLKYDKKKEKQIEIDKSNILIVGETGTGKTLFAKTIAKLLNVPFAIVDATILTEAGYVGEDIESILSRLLQAANYNIKNAEKGIIFIDEIDKIARKGDSPSITRDVSGEGVQQGLLKLLEGSIVNIPPYGGRKHPEQQYIQINTKNILFIAGGTFYGIEQIIKNRLNKNRIGFQKSNNNIDSESKTYLSYINTLDLRKFGIIPELLGRFPIISYLDSLNRNTLIKILTEPKNSIIKQYEELFKLDGIKLLIDAKVYEKIVDKSLKLGLGARGLRTIIEEMFETYFYNINNLKDELYIKNII